MWFRRNLHKFIICQTTWKEGHRPSLSVSHSMSLSCICLSVRASSPECMHINLNSQDFHEITKIPLSVMLGSPTCSVRTFPWFLSIPTIFAYNWASFRPARMLPAKYIFLDMMMLGVWCMRKKVNVKVKGQPRGGFLRMFATPKQTGRSSLLGRSPIGGATFSGRRSLQATPRGTPSIATK